MTRESPAHRLLGASPALTTHDAALHMALSVAEAALRDEEDESIIALGPMDASGTPGRKQAASPCLSLWSVDRQMIDYSGMWASVAKPVAVPSATSHPGHRKAASVGAAPESYLSRQLETAQSAGLQVSILREPISFGNTTSLPTSPTEATLNSGSFDLTPSAHLLSRSVSPPRTGRLSARAAPFQLRHQAPPSPGQPSSSQLPQFAPAPTPRQIQLRLAARPQLPQHRATAPVPSAPYRPKHVRSRSDLVVTSLAVRPSLPVVQEVAAPLEHEHVSVVPPPRCATPQPFRRPSSTANAVMPDGWFAAWAPGPGKRLPSLAEIAARMQARGKIAPMSPPRQSTNAELPSDSPKTSVLDSPARNKRYSLESTSSVTSSEGASDNQSGSSSTSCTDEGLPATPFKSRLPPFLQHRRTDSTSTMSSGCQSPSYMTSFREAARAALMSPDKVPATSTSPAVRITPPIETSNMSEPRFMITPPSAGGLCSPLGQNVELKGVPQIMCTPASATGTWISLNDDEDKVQRAAVPVLQSVQAAQREEKSKVMLSKLKRRSLDLKA